MPFGVVYKAINTLNGKSYVGQTIQPLNIRIRTHINDAIREADDIYFHKAIRRYGKENFKWGIIAECESIEELNRREIEMIRQHSTFGGGYNLTKGGDGKTGCKYTDESRKKMSVNNRGIGNPNYGKHHTDESKKKISEANTGRLVGDRHPSSKKYIITTPSGETIFVYGLRKFCRNYKKEKLGHSTLSRVAQGELKQHKGYRCEYWKENKNAEKR